MFWGFFLYHAKAREANECESNSLEEPAPKTCFAIFGQLEYSGVGNNITVTLFLLSFSENKQTKPH